jgi:hypothetical protein
MAALTRKALRIVGVRRRRRLSDCRGGHDGVGGKMESNGSGTRHGSWLHRLAGGTVALALASHLAAADEGGESFWTPGSFGSLAATPSQPGFSLTSGYYHTSTSAGSEVARARSIRIGRFPVSVAESVSAISISPEDLATVSPSYTFATPVLGGQAAVALTASYGRKRTTNDEVLNAPLLVGPFAITRSRFDTVSDVVTGFGDLSPQFSLRWNAGVHNVMTYVTGNIPVGAYNPPASRISGSDTARWTAVSATPISASRPAMNFRRSRD